MINSKPLLTVDKLCVTFRTDQGLVPAVQDFSYTLNAGETLAIVGESGSGKSVGALALMRLIPDPPGKISSGSIQFDNRDILAMSESEMQKIRGNEIAMIFQEPMTSLNPVYSVGDQIVEAIRLHQKKNKTQAWADAIELLDKVGIADAAQRAVQYPHQMSGGMRQRVMIAMAVSCQPDLLIADEPTTALDVTTQAQILDELDELQEQNGMSILLITHDLGVVAERADDVAVMYASRIVEIADSKPLFAEPLHPYTQGLLKSLPRLGFLGDRLYTVAGNVPDPLHFPAGCKFHPRCPVGCDDKRCQTVEPELREVKAGRFVRCWWAAGYETEDEHKEYELKYGKHE